MAHVLDVKVLKKKWQLYSWTPYLAFKNLKIGNRKGQHSGKS